MILVLDKRSRKLEQESIIRGQELERRQREAQQIQMERFNSWVQDNSKQQVFLLESIMASLGNDQKQAFNKEVSSRYREEITKDIGELKDLLVKKEKEKAKLDPRLDSEIDSKIDEIESAQNIASSFFPPSLIESIKKVSSTAKNSFEHLQKLAALEELSVDLGEDEKINIKPRVKTDDKETPSPLEEFNIEKEKLEKEMDVLKSEIQHSIAETTSQISSKIANLFNPKGIEKGLKDLISKEKEKEPKEESED